MKDNSPLLPYLPLSPQPHFTGGDFHAGILDAEKELLCLNVPTKDVFASNGHSLSVLRSSSPAADSVSLTDALSFRCNLDCVYCPLRNVAGEIPEMTPEERTAIWQEVADAFSVKKFPLTLFGGEPFLNVPYIQKLLTLAEEKEIPISPIEVVTNGTIAGPEVIRLINQYHISKLRITLDGPGEIHNARRPMKNGEDGYSLILDNMDIFLSETAAGIRINTMLDRHTACHYSRMIRDLNRRFAPYMAGKPSRITFTVNSGVRTCHQDLE